MSIETPEDAIEGVILDDIADLHRAMYTKLSEISGVTGLEFLGFDSGKMKNPLPQIAMQITLDDLVVDRNRPTPLEGNRVEENAGSEIINSYTGETFTGYDRRTLRYPLPVLATYHIDTWCHSAQTQLTLMQKLFQKFPERGVVTLEIGDEDYDFPIELLGVEVLDDLSQNLRERIFRFRLEAWVKSHISDGERQVIQSSELDVHKGSEAEDINLPGNRIPTMTVLDEPE